MINLLFDSSFYLLLLMLNEVSLFLQKLINGPLLAVRIFPATLFRGVRPERQHFLVHGLLMHQLSLLSLMLTFLTSLDIFQES